VSIRYDFHESAAGCSTLVSTEEVTAAEISAARTSLPRSGSAVLLRLTPAFSAACYLLDAIVVQFVSGKTDILSPAGSGAA